MAGMYLLQWVAKKRHFASFVNFSSGTLTRENDQQDPFGFGEQPRHQKDFDDVIEGEFEERPDAKSYINQKRGPTTMTVELKRSDWLF